MSETTKIATSVRSRASTKKKRKNQLPIGITVFAVLIGFGIFLGVKSASMGIFWITGICFGYILQKSRFCFTASLRDPYLIGSTSITRAVLVAFAITTIGFAAIKYGAFVKGLPIPGQSFIVPISFATAAGAFMFGIGMVISGGCASGTLMRVGEGFTTQMLSLVFFIVGSLWGTHDFGWWKYNFIMKGKSVFLPDVFGWISAVILQLLVIAVLFILADKWENKDREE